MNLVVTVPPVLCACCWVITQVQGFVIAPSRGALVHRSNPFIWNGNNKNCQNVIESHPRWSLSPSSKESFSNRKNTRKNANSALKAKRGGSRRNDEEQEDEFLSAQKLETIQEFAAFHDGTWYGTRVTSFSITSDVAAGVVNVVRQKTSSSSSSSLYTINIETRLESTGLKLRETMEWQNDSSNSSDKANTKIPNVARRNVPLGESVDIDSVDGSYSLDGSLPFWNDIPTIMTGLSEGTLIKFGIEHCIATSDHHRVRNFILYDMNDQLCRIIVCDEERLNKAQDDNTQSTQQNESDFSFSTSLDSEEKAASKDIDDLVSRLLSENNNSPSSNNIIDATIVSSSNTETNNSDKSKTQNKASKQNIGPITSDTPVEERMAKLNEALGGAKIGTNNSNNNKSSSSVTIERLPMSLFSLISGVWLGDAIVRNHFSASKKKRDEKKKKGFSSGTTRSDKPNEGAGMSDGFAEWVTGVQKVALLWKWDFSERVMERFTAGRSMGVPIQPHSIPSTSRGTLISNDMARGKEAEDRLAYIDYDMGQYAAFLLGSVYIKAPRQIKATASEGDNSSTKSAKKMQPFHTEFAVFQQQSSNDSIASNSSASSSDQQQQSSIIDNKARLDELVKQAKAMEGIVDDNGNVSPETSSDNGDSFSETYCSRLTRFYDASGTLRQGTSSFFKLDNISSSKNSNQPGTTSIESIM